jgi:4-amino-4-deoxy-L-arabinose transferase-like glycosyltransferase
MASNSEKPINESTPMPRWVTLLTIILGVGFLTWQFIVFNKGTNSSDGESYYLAWECIKQGYPDPVRTPIYSIFVGLINDIVGKGYSLIIIPIIHWTLYLGTLQLMWRINCWLKISKGFNICAILSMLLIPGFWVLNHFTMAECMSICEIILLIWLSGRYILTNKQIYLISAGLLLPILFMTKPMFVMLIPVMFVFWGIVCWKKRRHLAISAGCSALSLLVLLVYILAFNHLYHIPSLTSASTWNEYIMLRSNGLITPQDIDDPELRKEFQPYYDDAPCGNKSFNPYWHDVYGMGGATLYKLNQIAREKHPSEVRRMLAHQFVLAQPYSHFLSIFNDFGYDATTIPRYAHWNGMTWNQHNGYIYPLHKYLWYPLWAGELVLLLFAIISIRELILTKKIPSLRVLLVMMMFTAYVTAYLGSHDSWGRILTPLNPLIPIMAASVASFIKDYVKKGNRKRGLEGEEFA